jgi:hypothetical protein
MKSLKLTITEFNNFKILANKANEQYNATIKNGLVIITASIAFLQSLGY